MKRASEKIWNFLKFGAAGGGFALIYLPLAWMVSYSFLIPNPETSTHSWGFGLYREVFNNSTLVGPLTWSLLIATLSSAAAAVIGTMAALTAERSKTRLRPLLAALSMVTLTMPEVVVGIALLMWFSLLKMTLGFWTLLVAHITFCISYVFITVSARLREFDGRVEEAAEDLGATPAQAFRLVTLPIIAPSIFSGAALAFVMSFDDFLISYFTTGVGLDTLPIKLYSMIKFGLSPSVFALSSMLLFVTTLGVLGVLRAGHGRRSSPTDVA